MTARAVNTAATAYCLERKARDSTTIEPATTMNLTIASLGTVTRDHSADPAINAAIAAILMALTNLASVRLSCVRPFDTQASHAAPSSGVDGGGSHTSGGLIDT